MKWWRGGKEVKEKREASYYKQNFLLTATLRAKIESAARRCEIVLQFGSACTSFGERTFYDVGTSGMKVFKTNYRHQNVDFGVIDVSHTGCFLLCCTSPFTATYALLAFRLRRCQTPSTVGFIPCFKTFRSHDSAPRRFGATMPGLFERSECGSYARY